MKPNKSILLVLLVGLLLAIFAVSMAQSTSQNAQAKKGETSCCSMDSCCCKGDSCPMKDSATAKDAKDGCCSGDSCDMNTHENMKSHASGQECCCDAKHENSKAKPKAA